jgi:hypothetical protein
MFVASVGVTSTFDLDRKLPSLAIGTCLVRTRADFNRCRILDVSVEHYHFDRKNMVWLFSCYDALCWGIQVAE